MRCFWLKRWPESEKYATLTRAHILIKSHKTRLGPVGNPPVSTATAVSGIPSRCSVLSGIASTSLSGSLTMGPPSLTTLSSYVKWPSPSSPLPRSHYLSSTVIELTTIRMCLNWSRNTLCPSLRLPTARASTASKRHGAYLSTNSKGSCS